MPASLEALLQEVPIPAPGKQGLTPPDLTAARACVEWMALAIVHLNQKIGFEPQASIYVRDLVLSSASQAAVFWRHGWGEQARASLLHSWIDRSLALQPAWENLHDWRIVLSHDQFKPEAAKLPDSESDREFVLVFIQAVASKLSADQTGSQARHALRQLLERLELSTADLGRWLAVPAQTVEQWESDKAPIPPDVRAKLSQANNSLSRLLSIFRPERLPQVIRQAVGLFGGESAYAWIINGRIQEVADRYESAFTYQG